MHQQRYDYRDPDVKRILLTKDPSNRSLKADGLGLKIVGGKPIPDGQLGAVVTQVHRPAMVETMGQVRKLFEKKLSTISTRRCAKGTWYSSGMASH